jgi:hypothetical protein
MGPRRVFGAAFAAAWTAAGGVGDPQARAAGFEKQELRVPGSILWVDRGDLDGDGDVDLVVTYRRKGGPSAERYVGVFRRTDDGFDGRPDPAFRAPEKAAVFDLADVDGDPGVEMLYMTSRGVYAQSLAKAPGRPYRIVATRSLVGRPEEDDLIHWDVVRRLGDDGPQVVVVPQRTGLDLYRREGPVWKHWTEVELPNLQRYDAYSDAFRPAEGSGSPARPYSFRAQTMVPNLAFVDQTGDGRTDLVTHYEDRIAVFVADATGKPGREPAYERFFGVRTDEEIETREAFVGAVVQDLDGDGVADLALSKLAGGLTNLRSRVWLYAGRPGGGFEARPSQSFEERGFSSLVAFEDVDGDGKVEMLHPQMAVSIGTFIQALTSRTLTIDVRIRRADPSSGFFAGRPAQTLPVRLGLDFSDGGGVRGAPPLFGHDLDGDGVPDAIVSDGGKVLRVYKGRKAGERDGEPDPSRSPFRSQGYLTLEADISNTTVMLPSGQDGLPDVLIYHVARKDRVGSMVVFRNGFE